MKEAPRNYIIRELTDQLFSNDAQMRSAAAYRLAFEGDQSAIPALLKTLKDCNPEVREMAIFAIKEIGLKVSYHSVELLSLLRHPNSEIRVSAISCIDSLEVSDVDLSDTLIELFNDPDMRVRRAASWILRNTKTESLCKAIGLLGVPLDRLVSQLTDMRQSIQIRVKTVFALSQHGSLAADTLEQCLKWKDLHIRRSALISLAKIGGSAYSIVASCCFDNEAEIRQLAVQSLSLIGGDEAVPLVVSMLEDADKGVRADAAFALSKVKDKHGISSQALIKRLNDIDQEVRFAATMALGMTKFLTPQIVSSLLSALNDTDSSVRSQSVNSLIQLFPDREHALLYLVDLACHSDTSINSISRDVIFQFLCERETIATIYALGRLLKDGNRTLRCFAAAALSEYTLSDAYVLRDLADALSDEDDEVRFLAAVALESSGSHAFPVLPSLICAINDSSWGVRSVASRVIGEMGSKATIAEPALREALNDPNPIVRFFAARSLICINPSSSFPVSIIIDYANQTSDTAHRRIAIEALGRLTILPEEAFRFLKESERDEDPTIRKAAQNALEKWKRNKN